MRIELKQGEKIEVTLDDTDGVFTISYGKPRGRKPCFVRVECNLPDTKGRAGIIYEEVGELYGDGVFDMEEEYYDD